MKEVTLASRCDVRLGDLRGWHVLSVTCGRKTCGHVGAVSSAWLRRRWPNGTRIIDLESKLRCSRSGNRKRNEWKVMKLPR